MRTRRLFVESLESRRLLAGNVTARVVDGELRITGDGSANWIEVRQVPGNDGTGRTFVVQGRPFNGAYDAGGRPLQGAADTLVNGSSGNVVLFASTDQLRIAMGGGNDAVDLGTDTAVTTAAGLVVSTGAGRDFVEVERVTMNGTAAPVSIHTGADAEALSETVRLERVFVPNQSLNLSTGGGSDRVFLDVVRVGGNLAVNLGAGADTMFGNTLVLNTATFNGGSSAERDELEFSHLDAVQLRVALGAGDDRVWFREDVRVTSKGTINGGDGSDTLILGQTVGIQDLARVSIENTIQV